MAVSIDTMVRRMHTLRDKIEDGVIGDAAADLERIFARAERGLARHRRIFNRLLTDPAGNIQQTPENIALAGEIVAELQTEIEKWIVKPGQAWAKEKTPLIHQAGRDLARQNFDVEFISPEQLKSAFANVSPAERAVLKVGFQDQYRIMNVVGSDVAEWFRREMLDAIIEGIPVQGAGDTLTNRLIESGRLKPQTIHTETGRIIRRSIRQRATTIARVESARISNNTHTVLSERILGAGESVYINSNPRDSRTTRICERASSEEPKTLAQWDASEFGRPPRLNPFHMCRSVLIGGKRGWFSDRKPGKLTETPLPPPRRLEVFTPAKTTAEAQKYAKDAKFVTGKLDYTGLDADTANEVNRGLHEMQVKRGYRKLDNLTTTKRGSGGSLADALQGDIRLHPPMFDNVRVKASAAQSTELFKSKVQGRADTLKKLKEEYATGGKDPWVGRQIKAMERDKPAPRWTVGHDLAPTSGAYSTIIHEYGHVAHHFGGILRGGSKDGKDLKLGWGFGYKELGGTSKDILKQMKGTIGAKGKRVAKEISEYAAQNTKEHFAEAWTAYHLGRKELISANVLKVVEEVIANIKAGGK